MFIARKVSYEDYLKSHAPGSPLAVSLDSRVESGELSQEDRGKWPISKEDWIAEQGSEAGNVCVVISIPDNEEVPPGFYEISEDEYAEISSGS